MANTQPPRNPNLKSNVRIRTIIAVAAFTLGAFGLLIYQLYALQLRDAEHYRTEAVTQQLKDTTLPALPGPIREERRHGNRDPHRRRAYR